MTTETVVVIMFTYFIVKHFICDFPIKIQTPWMFLNKGTYGHPGGMAHALIQGIASAPILILTAGCSDITPWAGTLLVGEILVHYHMDWFKIWLNKRNNYHPQTPQFWTLLGIDQLVHYLTYVGMTVVWLW